ncbi:hypothetical protein AYO08_06015 [Pseudomonas putida]|uniref:hypothetical protein n=1 Tax=Pseudomonas putida TaxID=303 RepID=UPI0007DC2F0A|nr:hypothetical protein [Pseudomonas putida]OAS12294.1 hypothetical protein AYO08_06015 [Pseudomonas putida]
MATKSIPLYGRITSAQVLEVLKYSSGKDLTTQQAQLTTACNQLEQLSTPNTGLSELLAMEERDLLKRAAELLRDLNRHVERAKEVRVALEKREDKARKAYLGAISGLIAKRFPSVTDETPGRAEQLLEIMELHLALFDCNYLEDYYDGGLSSQFGRDFDRFDSGEETLTQAVNGAAQNLRYDLGQRLGYSSKQPDPAKALQAVIEEADQLRPGAKVKNAGLFQRIERVLAREQDARLSAKVK